MDKGRAKEELLRSTNPAGPPERAPQNIQDNFLHQLRRERTPVAILLTNGTQLSGRIKNFDKYSLVLESLGQEQLLFKHAIATVAAMKGSGGGAQG